MALYLIKHLLQYLIKHYLMQYLNTDLPLYLGLDLVVVAILPRQGLLDYLLDKNLKRPGFTAKPVNSAFEAMGKSTPLTLAAPTTVTNELLLSKLVEAVSGERRTAIPSWDGSPSGLRSWLKALSFWESDNGTNRTKWGIKLYQSLSGEAKKIADTVASDTLLSEHGYGAVLTALMNKYEPYLEAVGPLSVDTFLYPGQRQGKETFTSFLARKETQKQEMEAQLGAHMRPFIAGRVLMRQANLSEHQQHKCWP